MSDRLAHGWALVRDPLAVFGVAMLVLFAPITPAAEAVGLLWAGIVAGAAGLLAWNLAQEVRRHV